MHFRRFSTFLLGAWLAGSLFMAMVATQNFRAVDRLLANPSPAAAQEIGRLGRESARALLRYQVSEQNRWYFQTWELMELALGLTLLLVLVFGSLETLFSLMLALAMLLIVVAQHFFLTPEIVALGRLIDFRPASQHVGRFWVMHGAYSGLEVLKWLVALLLGGKLVIGTPRFLRDPGRKINLVDKADYRHIDG
jgi:hypothetical protein